MWTDLDGASNSPATGTNMFIANYSIHPFNKRSMDAIDADALLLDIDLKKSLSPVTVGKAISMRCACKVREEFVGRMMEMISINSNVRYLWMSTHLCESQRGPATGRAPTNVSHSNSKPAVAVAVAPRPRKKALAKAVGGIIEPTTRHSGATDMESLFWIVVSFFLRVRIGGAIQKPGCRVFKNLLSRKLAKAPELVSEWSRTLAKADLSDPYGAAMAEYASPLISRLVVYFAHPWFASPPENPYHAHDVFQGLLLPVIKKLFYSNVAIDGVDPLLLEVQE